MDLQFVKIPARSRRQALDWSLVLVSQGIETTIDADTDGAQWGLDDVLPLIVAPPVAGMTEPQRLLRAVREHAKNPDFDDDFTVVVATFL